MIKTVQFGDKTVNFSTAFAWTFKYKAQFGRDAAKVLIPTVKKMQEPDLSGDDQAYMLYEELGFSGIAEIAWSMAALLDKNIPDPSVWVASFGDDFDSSELIDVVIDAIWSCFASKKSMAPIPKTEQKKTAPAATKKSAQK